jgi:hypothetical protein
MIEQYQTRLEQLELEALPHNEVLIDLKKWYATRVELI